MDNIDRSDWCRICAVEQKALPGASTDELKSCALALWAELETFRLIREHHGEMREVAYQDGRPPSFVVFVPERAMSFKTNVDDVKHFARSYIAGWLAGRKYWMTVKRTRARSRKAA